MVERPQFAMQKNESQLRKTISFVQKIFSINHKEPQLNLRWKWTKLVHLWHKRFEFPLTEEMSWNSECGLIFYTTLIYIQEAWSLHFTTKESSGL